MVETAQAENAQLATAVLQEHHRTLHLLVLSSMAGVRDVVNALLVMKVVEMEMLKCTTQMAQMMSVFGK